MRSWLSLAFEQDEARLDRIRCRHYNRRTERQCDRYRDPRVDYCHEHGGQRLTIPGPPWTNTKDWLMLRRMGVSFYTPS